MGAAGSEQQGVRRQNRLLPCPALGFNSLFRVMIPTKQLVLKLSCVQRPFIYQAWLPRRGSLLLGERWLCSACSRVHTAESASTSVCSRGASPWLMTGGIVRRGEHGCTHTLLPLIGLAQLPTQPAPLKSCPTSIHFSSVRKRAQPPTPKP